MGFDKANAGEDFKVQLMGTSPGWLRLSGGVFILSARFGYLLSSVIIHLSQVATCRRRIPLFGHKRVLVVGNQNPLPVVRFSGP